jgi:hypothetical protein
MTTYKQLREMNQKALTATEKIIKIKECKELGLTQIQTAHQLQCCRATVARHWNSDEYISKQDCSTIARQQKKAADDIIIEQIRVTPSKP